MIQSLLGLSGGGLEFFFGLHAGALLQGEALALPGALLWPFAHEPFPGILHLGFNAYLLWWFGPEVEALFRGRKFWKLFLCSAVAGLALRLALGAMWPAQFAQSWVVGGSGVVFSLLAVQAAVYPDRQLRLLFIPISFRLIRLFQVLLVLDVLGFLYTLSGQGVGIASDIHLAGAAVGWYWGGGFHRVPVFWERIQKRMQSKKRQQERGQRRETEAELDRILEKISRQGIGSLTPEERAFLDRRSGGRG